MFLLPLFWLVPPKRHISMLWSRLLGFPACLSSINIFVNGRLIVSVSVGETTFFVELSLRSETIWWFIWLEVVMMLSMLGVFSLCQPGAPIYGFFFVGSQICRIIEIAWTIWECHTLLNMVQHKIIYIFNHGANV